MTNIIPITETLATAKTVTPYWPEPTPLPTKLLPVPDFDIGMLPTRLGPWVEDISDRLAIPPDFAGIASMVSAGAMIGSKLAIRPQEHTTWAETFNLWGAIIGNPSALKTPAISEVLQPIRRMEARLNQSYQNEMAYYEMEMKTYSIRRDVAEKKAKKLFAEGKDAEAAALLEDAGPNPPRQPRLLVGNTTVEKLGEICRDNPNGILVEVDEFVTLLNDLSHPEKEMARGFMMTGWGGAMPYTFDRIIRGTTRVERVTLSMIGTSQPQVFSAFLANALSRRNDGIAQRVQMLGWPNMVGEWRNVARPPNALARDDAFTFYEQMVNLIPESVGAMRDSFDDGTGIPFLRFNPDALALFNDWRQRLEIKVRGDAHPAILDHLGKYRGLSARLAGICHLASGDSGPVTLRAAEQALAWMEYLEAHARRAYGSVTIDDHAAARSILDRIRKGQLEDGFTASHIYSKGWFGLQSGPKLNEALKVLCEYDWLRSKRIETSGRPKTIYNINPAVWSGASFH